MNWLLILGLSALPILGLSAQQQTTPVNFRGVILDEIPQSRTAFIVDPPTVSMDSGETDWVFDMPAETQSGELLLAVIANAHNTSELSWPEGWTQLGRAGTDCRLSIAWRIADGSEGGSDVPVSISWGGPAAAIGAVYRIGNAAPSAPDITLRQGVGPEAVTGGLSASSCDSLWMVIIGRYRAGTAVVTQWPTTYTQHRIEEHNGEEATLVVAAKTVEGLCDDDPDNTSFSGPNRGYGVATLAIAPREE